MSDKLLHRLLAIAIFLVSFVTYLLTMSVTVSFWDSGEFIATSYILGIPHSPGTPLYVLIGRVFSMLPLALSIAQKVNFLSVVFGALGVLMAYLIMIAVIRFMYGPPKSAIGRFIQYAGPSAGALYLTFSHTYWWDATEAEVYSIGAFLMGFCTLLALKWYRNPSGAIDEETRESLAAHAKGKELEKLITAKERAGRAHATNLVFLIVYLLALGIGIHLGTILVYGGIFLLLLFVRKKTISNAELLVFTFGLAVIIADMTLHRQSHLTIAGLIIFAILVIWSTISRGRFALIATALLVLGISVHLYLLIRAGLNPAINEVDPDNWRSLYAHLRREQYPPATLSALLNRKSSFLFQLQHFGRYFREQFRMFGDVMIGPLNIGQATVAIPTALGLYGIITNFNKERKVWLVNFMILFLNSFGLIIFLNFSDSEVRERDYFYSSAFYYFSIFIGIGASALLIMLVEYFKRLGEKYIRSVVLVGAVLVFCSVLPATYHWFSHDRSNNYIARDYAYNMLVGCEPDAILFTNGDNDTFPLWYIQTVENFRTDVRVANRSLLRTSWYTKQVRDEEPTAPITLTDEEIEQMRPVPLKGGGIAWRDALTIQHIIQTAQWQRPIYFATTVPIEVWRWYAENLELQGMLRRLVPFQGKELMNDFMIARNLDHIFEFRGVLTEDGEVDHSLYKNEDTENMFVNFAVAAATLAQRKAHRKEYEEAIEKMELAAKLDPSFGYPKILLGSYYLLNGEPKRAIDHYMRVIREDPRNGEYWIMLAKVYEYQGMFDLALQNLNEGIRMAPDNRQLYVEGFRLAAQAGQREIAKDFIKRWLDKNPGDKQLQSLYEDIDNYIEEQFGQQEKLKNREEQ